MNKECNVILVVDDDPDVRAPLTRLLQEAHYQVYNFASGVEAWSWLQNHQTELILCDWIMPALDGVELCRQVRKEARLAQSYFMLLASKGRSPEKIVSALDAGVDEFVSKPYNKDVLLARIRAALRQRRLSKEFTQAEKSSAVATLTSGIAHDFNNLLTSAKNNISTLRKLHKAEEELKVWQDIEAALQRMAKLTEQMLTFAGQGKYRDETVNINALVENALAVHYPHAHRWIEMELEIGLPYLFGDPVQLQHMFLGIVENSVEAMEQREGNILIRTWLANKVLDHWDEPPAAVPPWVIFEVQDSGCGMTTEVLSRVCEPFFTTKFDGRGLGLAAVQGIAQAHGGRLYIQSQANQGTLVQVALPLPANRSTIEAPMLRVL